MISGTRRRPPLAGIEAMEQYYREIGMPTSVRELGHDLNESEIQLLAEKCARRTPIWVASRP